MPNMSSIKTAIFALLSAPLWLIAAAGAAQDASGPWELAAARLEERRASLIEFRRDLHRHPEVSGAEERTARRVAEHLRALGIEVRTGIGGHGVVGLVRGIDDSRWVAFRADMDAMRSGAPDPVAFASETSGVRHICGHDVHTTIGIALAEAFAAIRDQLPGSVMLIFQPAEENATGARAMLADGVFADPVPGAIFGYHTAPLEVGTVAVAPVAMMAGRDEVKVTLTGQGDLGAAATAVRSAIEQTGTLKPAQAFAPTTGDFIFAQVGPALAEPKGGLRVRASITTPTATASAQAREEIARRFSELTFANVTIDHTYEDRVIAGVTNTPALVERATRSVESVLGKGTVLPLEAVVPAFSEDFGSFQERVPGVMFFLGVSNTARGWVGMPHSPGYVADEEAISIGARAMARVLIDFLEPLSGSTRED